MTIINARKILGELAKNLTDEELLDEIEFAEFMAELIIKEYMDYPKRKVKN